MCGIAGILNLNDCGPREPETIIRMARTMVHRGPDDEGFFQTGPIALAHRRLSIIDVAAGHQPMFNEDRSIAIVFNGEIYNHLELRALLEAKGHTYRTHSDTESIVHAYEEFGEDFEQHLTGMFAFAIWDDKRRRLVLSRDRLGIKPLYYTIQGDRLLFASEIKAILAATGEHARVDLDALDAYFSLRYVPAPRTLFQGIFKVEPGSTLVVEGSSVRSRRYWDLRFEEEVVDEERACEEFNGLLRRVCEDHLMSEVPYGVFLSGGIDSSSVVAVLHEILRSAVATFTVGYHGASGVNEFDYAERVARYHQTEHHPLTLRADDFAEWIPQLVWHLDEPIADSACIPLYFLARLAKQHATVLESGEGADEILGGYSLYKKMTFMAALQRGRMGHLAGQMSKLAPLTGRGKIARYLRLLEKPVIDSYRGLTGHFMEGVKEAIVKPGIFDQCTYLDETFERYHRMVDGQSDLNRMLYVDTKTWLPDDLLVKADKMTMAASVELRVPFLDHRLVQFAARLPVSLKIRQKETKYLLKKVMEGRLPEEVIYRPKKGFPVPVAAWLRNGLGDFACETLLHPKSAVGAYADMSVVAQMLERHRAGRANYADQLWNLLVLECWFKQFRVTV